MVMVRVGFVVIMNKIVKYVWLCILKNGLVILEMFLWWFFIVFSRGMKNEVVGVFFVMRSIKIDSVNSMVSFSVIFFLELGLI